MIVAFYMTMICVHLFTEVYLRTVIKRCPLQQWDLQRSYNGESFSLRHVPSELNAFTALAPWSRTYTAKHDGAKYKDRARFKVLPVNSSSRKPIIVLKAEWFYLTDFYIMSKGRRNTFLLLTRYYSDEFKEPRQKFPQESIIFNMWSILYTPCTKL